LTKPTNPSTSHTAHWLAIEGVQPAIPQNPTTAETSSKELLPKGPGANPALAALAGNDNVSFRPAVKHVISKELILYFDKIQAAILDEDPDEEKVRFRAAALESVRSDPGLHQLLPYFVTFVTNQVTHRLDDTFVLRQMMELTEAIIDNPHMFLEPYASALSVPVLTCLMSRKLGGGGDGGDDALVEQYRLRELAASLLGSIAKKYSRGNSLLRPKLTRTCLKYFLDPTRSPAVLFGAVKGLAEVGGPEAVRVLLVPNLKPFDEAVLRPLKEKGGATGGGLELEALVGGIMGALWTLCNGTGKALEATGPATSPDVRSELVEFVGETVGDQIARSRKEALIKAVLEARAFE
jgi:transcription initiation factor TFIID subunit 6